MFILQTNINDVPNSEERIEFIIATVYVSINSVYKCLSGLTSKSDLDTTGLVTLHTGQEPMFLPNTDILVGYREITHITRSLHSDASIEVKRSLDTLVKFKLLDVFSTLVKSELTTTPKHLEFSPDCYPVVVDGNSGQVTLRDFLSLYGQPQLEITDSGVTIIPLSDRLVNAKTSVGHYMNSRNFRKTAIETLPSKVQQAARQLLDVSVFTDGVFGVVQIGDCLRLDFGDVYFSTLSITLAKNVFENTRL